MSPDGTGGSPLSRGVDDPADPSEDASSLRCRLAPSPDGANGDGTADAEADFDAYLDKLVSLNLQSIICDIHFVDLGSQFLCAMQEAALREQCLENNSRIAALRRGPLQSSAVRGELAAAQAQIERERSVMVRWRKSKSYVPLGGRSGGTGGAGGGSIGPSGATIGGSANSGGSGRGKGGHIHRKKHGGY